MCAEGEARHGDVRAAALPTRGRARAAGLGTVAAARLHVDLEAGRAAHGRKGLLAAGVVARVCYAVLAARGKVVAARPQRPADRVGGAAPPETRATAVRDVRQPWDGEA